MESTAKRLNKGQLTRLYWLKSTGVVVSAGTALQSDSTYICKTSGGIYIGAITNQYKEIIAIAQMTYQQYSDCFDEANNYQLGDANRWHTIAEHVYKCSPDYVFVAEHYSEGRYESGGWLQRSTIY